MKKFILKILLFGIPLILFIVVINYTISLYPSPFRNKANYLEKNKNKIEVLFLGSSHMQDAINPLLLSKNSSNLAYNTQDIKTNYLLFEKYINQLPELKYVVFEFDYFSLEQPLDFIKYNEALYRKFHNFPRYNISTSKVISSVGDLPFFLDFFKTSFRYHLDNRIRINESGFSENNDKVEFKLAHFDKQEIEKTAAVRLSMRHREESVPNYRQNTAILNKLIQKCESRNIELIFINLPKYHTYIERERPAKIARRQHYLDSILNHSKVVYFDFENDHRFRDITNYSNDNHLIDTSGNKFTLIVDSLINHLN